MSFDWSRLEAARSYIEHGWAVLPLHSIRAGKCSCGKAACASPGKHPRTMHGVKDASKDEDQITAWWTEWQDSNVGIALGAISAMGAIDVDPRNGGMENLPAIETPPTRTEGTGGGGLHLWYHHAGPLASRILAKGVELKGDGSYIVVTPSNHVLGQYAWIDQRDLAELPASLNGGIAWDEKADDYDDPTLLAHARLAKNGDKFIGLFDDGDLDDYDGDESSADLALCDLLAFWTKDATRIDRLFRQSALMRPKWDEKRGKTTYGARTIAKALELVTEGFEQEEAEPAPSEEASGPVWSVGDLLSTDFPPLQWIVEDLLPEGLCLLAGRPKRGKSWMALQIALDVVSGGHSLGRTTRGRVLYIALEDSPRRLQSRLRQKRATVTKDLHFVTILPSLDKGGLKQLVAYMDQYNPVLVVIDTLARVTSRKRDQDSTGDMTDFLAPLQVLASQRHCCILLVDHHRKPGAEIVDMIDDIAGSTAKTAVADAILGLYRKSQEQSAILKVVGRDVEDRELNLTWDGLRFTWRLDDGPSLTQMQKQIIEALKILREGTETAIASQIGVTGRWIRESLHDLVVLMVIQQEALESGKRGHPFFVYRLAPLER